MSIFVRFGVVLACFEFYEKSLDFGKHLRCNNISWGMRYGEEQVRYLQSGECESATLGLEFAGFSSHKFLTNSGREIEMVEE